MIPSMNRNTGLDTSDEDTKGFSSGGSATSDEAENPTGGQPISDAKLLQLAQEAESQSSSFMQTGVRPQWARSYRSYRNQHFHESKYNSPEYRGRSKFFRPKTRIAVKKKMAAAAQALFSTGDVISVSAQNETDDFQKASAAIKQQLLNYRLSRSTRRNGIQWFMIASGAVQTAAITGLIISKQTWRYKEDKSAGDNPRQEGGYKQPKIIEDRPDIDLIPPENVLFDPNANWIDPAQSAQYVIIRYPQSVDDALEMIRQNVSAGDIPFLKITKADLENQIQTSGPMDTTAARTAREGGKDPTMQTSGHFGRIWLNEIFMRVGGQDMVFWTVNNTKLISKPVPVRKAYPAFGGDRPIVIGYGELEAFRPYPMSSVEALSQIQQEINDQSNLRLDHSKQVVSPPAKVKRGQKVDLSAVQNRGPNSIVMVNEMTDVEWWEQPDVPPSMYQENQLASADFDTLAGVFDAGSVANNREMNETVGGMRLLAAATNPMQDFDLNVLVETWAERVMCQLMKLEEFYETDATVLMIAGEKARLFERFGVSEITDTLLLAETTLTIKLGVGSANLPEDKIRRFNEASGVLMNFLKPFVEAKVIAPPVPRTKEIVDTIFGAAGFQDGGERFFGLMDDSGNALPPPPAPPADPGKEAAAQAKVMDVQQKREATQINATLKMHELEQKKQEAISKIEAEHMKALAEIAKAFAGQTHEAGMQGREHAHQAHTAHLDRTHQAAQNEVDRASDMAAQAFDGPPNAAQPGAPQQPLPQMPAGPDTGTPQQ